MNALQSPIVTSSAFVLDEIHFRSLHQQYFAPLVQLAVSLTGCPHDAKDVVIDVFAKLWRQRSTINIQSNLGAYLRSAVYNRSVDYLRKRQRKRIVSLELPLQRPCPAPRQDQRVVAQELSGFIAAAINDLPPKGQQIFRLSRFEGLTYQQIADKFGLSYKTVETHMRRNLIFLRKRLQPYVDCTLAH